MFNLFKSNRCVDGGNCHNFQPRYDTKSEPMKINVEGYGFDSYDYKRILDASRNNESVYIKDVCVWRGKEIKR